jgi:selenide,water dikinase
MAQIAEAEKTAALDKVAAVAGNEALELLKHATMRCGGCGAKVGATVLERTMSRIKSKIYKCDKVCIWNVSS